MTHPIHARTNPLFVAEILSGSFFGQDMSVGMIRIKNIVNDCNRLEPQDDPEQDRGRQYTADRGKKIAKYLKQTAKDDSIKPILPALTMEYNPDDVEFFNFNGKPSIAFYSKPDILDGNGRQGGLSMLLGNKEDAALIGEDTLPVLFLPFRGNKESRQRFSDMNTVTPMGKSERLRFNERTAWTVTATKLWRENAMLRDMIRRSEASASHNHVCSWWAYSVFADSIRDLIEFVTAENDSKPVNVPKEEQFSVLDRMISSLFTKIEPLMTLYTEGKILKQDDIRAIQKDNIIFRSNTLKGLCQALATLAAKCKENEAGSGSNFLEEWEAAVSLALENANWNNNATEWQGVLRTASENVYGGTGGNKAKYLFSYLFGVSDEEQEVKLAKAFSNAEKPMTEDDLKHMRDKLPPRWVEL